MNTNPVTELVGVMMIDDDRILITGSCNLNNNYDAGSINAIRNLIKNRYGFFTRLKLQDASLVLLFGFTASVRGLSDGIDIAKYMILEVNDLVKNHLKDRMIACSIPA